MTTEETLEYNRRCAEFLGVKPDHFGPSEEYEMYGVIECIDDGPNEKHFYMIEEMLFHSDWNWIHEIIEAIEKSGYQVDIQNNHCFIQKSESFGGNRVYAVTKKEAVVQAINQFLIWYNENNK